MMASARSRRAMSCRSSRRLRRNRWKGTLARRSSTDRFHSSVQAMGCVRRRSFRKYRRTSGGITAAARIRPAGIESHVT
jgi:hypothetical protein